ncbi:bifunctional 2-polyprenyl-6-hydroxyphenol methylase/3-demethylubiquinol 3-O-methyltransferase UbiG [Natrinema hispanicum]|uniref:Ubiquinone/menaquinone biosynthesis C-methylase UbiE n=1 Tax=Natrinema hispanicum TaxID=392421 RepID=A0A1I0IT58_9EURY|nr:class I SAM-dependent methyltransferase [Natrinema hispanicum]SDD23398.1 Ubiquinone/menaquinone biosynthesis C-methylase UbiE [Natrinema hispanicum]SEU00357.1 Ubiquinone/menaquinone biosynthesis C-methylase UbiE [Natrinema hispanicum]
MDGEAVGQYFNAEADTYTHEHSSNEIENSPIVDGFIEPTCERGDRMLEIGCGDGLLLEYALESTDITDAYGIDISTEMLPNAGDDVQAEYRRASATDLPLPFEPESFDFVMMSDVLHHLVGESRSASKRKAQAALIEAVNLLRPGGYLILKDIYYQSPVGPETLTSQLIFYGLKHLPQIASVVDEEVLPGLLVSFYTSDELVELLQQSGTRIVEKELEITPVSSLPRRLLIGKSGCIRLYAQKKERGRIRSGF